MIDTAALKEDGYMDIIDLPDKYIDGDSIEITLSESSVKRRVAVVVTVTEKDSTASIYLSSDSIDKLMAALNVANVDLKQLELEQLLKGKNNG